MRDKDRKVTFVQRLTVHTLYLTVAYNGTNIHFRRPTNVLLNVIFMLFIVFINDALF